MNSINLFPFWCGRLIWSSIMLQHLLVKHGDHFLQIIRNLSQGLNLSLDGEASLQTSTTTKTTVTNRVNSLTNRQEKLSPAKCEAWRMWHEDGFSIQKIAVCSIWYQWNKYLTYICVSILSMTSYFFNHRTSLVDRLLSKNKLF